MDVEIAVTRVVEALLLPPGSPLVLAAVSLLLWRRAYRTARVLLIAGFLLLYLTSIPFTASLLLALLETYPPVSASEPAGDGPQAIVVLGGGRYYRGPEYGTDTVSRLTLERLRYAARLHRRTGLPVLVSGGNRYAEKLPEAVLMQDTLEQDFLVPVAWGEGRSRTTRENALYSREILSHAGIDHVYLVTHAWHMPRAAASFRAVGLEVFPAPTGFTTPSPLERGPGGWLPTGRSLANTNLALHELLGHLWYNLW